MKKEELNAIKEKKGIITKLRDNADEKIDNVMALATAKAMENYYPRWCKISGVSNPKEIDWTIPCIEVESRLCDPRNLKLIRGGEHTPEFLEKLSSD